MTVRIGGSSSDWIRCCVLLLLSEQPSHGYKLLSDLELLGVYSIDSGTLYRVLRRLERDQMASSKWEDTGVGPARRVYKLTQDGRCELTDVTAELHYAGSLVDRFVARSGNMLTTK